MMVSVLLLLAASAGAPTNPAVDQAWTVLREGLDSKSSLKRSTSARALGLLTDNQRAQDWAEKALADPSPEVRAAAATALGHMGAASARPKLKEALNDKDITVVVSAANALYLLKDPAAYDVYYALLTGERKSSAGLVETQLSMFRNKREMEKMAFETGIGFVPFGGMGYEAWKRVTHDAATPVRVAVAAKLATDPDPKSGAALAKACSDKKWQVRAASVEGIAQRDDPALLQSIVMLLLDENDTVRNEAASAIIRLSAREQQPVTARK